MTRALRTSIALGLAAGLCAGGTAEAKEGDDLLGSLLAEHRLTLELVDGRLAGPGADFLLEAGREAHYFMIGEEHGVAEVPQLTSALFRALRPHGYDRLVIETSPGVALLLDRLARKGADAISDLEREYPLAIPFYTWHEESQLLVDAVRSAAGETPVLVGVDYEFMFSAPMWLAMLEERAPTETAAELAARFRGRAEAAEIALASGGQPGDLFLAAADSAAFAELQNAFAGDREARDIIDWMEASSEVWRLWFAGERYESNRLRIELARRAFIDAHRASRGNRQVESRAVLKLGANHLFRGRTPVNMYDLGTLAPMLAEYEGGTAFNVMVVGAAEGERAAFSPAGPHVQRATPAAWLAPLYDAADPQHWTLFDLRPLRPELDAGRLSVDDDLERLIWGYDSFLVMSGSRAAGFDAPERGS